MLKKINAALLALVLSISMWSYSRPAQADGPCGANRHLIMCDLNDYDPLCPTSQYGNACYEWCSSSTGQPPCDFAQCVQIGGLWTCKCSICVPDW